MSIFRIISLAIIFFSNLSAQWIVLDPLPQQNTLTSVYFVDENIGWAVGYNSTIIRTTDGGQSWETQQSTISSNFTSVFFIDNTTGWIVGYEKGVLLKTSNGGLNWNRLEFDSTNYLMSVYFVNSNLGWIVGDEGIYRTTDGGLNWDFHITTYLYSVMFANQNTGWAVGAAGVLLCTTDGGNSWNPQSSGTPYSLKSIHCIDENTAWAVGHIGTIIKTNDGGLNWITLSIDSLPWFESVNFLDNNFGWITGYMGTILYTTNGGTDWELQESGVSDVLYSLHLINNKGCVVGSSGAILYTTNGGVTDIQNNNNNFYSFNLSQNYPNPFNPITVIKFSISKSNRVTLKIYDILGREIKTLLNEEKTAGNYEIEFNATNLNSGLYFYRIFCDGYSDTKKMLLVK